MRFFVAVLLVFSLASCSHNSVTSPHSRNVASNDFSEDLSEDKLLADAKEALKAAETKLTELLAVQPPHTVANTYKVFNDLFVVLEQADGNAALVENLGTTDSRREEARKLQQEMHKFVTDKVSLNPQVYRAIKAIDVKSADKETKFAIERTLRDFRREGVDKDEATRKKVADLRQQLVVQTQLFEKNVAEDVRKEELSDASELSGLPEDYIKNHKPNEKGKIVITTDYPDYLPIREFSTNMALRKKMYVHFTNRGYPQNTEVLNQVLKLRYELAKTLGYASWAHYSIENRMMKTPQKARLFIDKLSKIVTPREKYDYQELLVEKRKDDPTAKEIFDYDKDLYIRRVKMTKVKYDSQEARAYFPYENVKRGVFAITSKLFGLSYKKVEAIKLWHPDVEAYDLFDGEKLLGRFYLDMFPREGKYKHAAHLGTRTGLKDGQLPQSVLMCNFSKPTGQDPGLLTFDDFQTFLHEFGHLLHSILSGNHLWLETSGNQTERDFIEAPSQFLEEWSKDYESLATFARHYQTGEVIPKALVDKINRSEDFNSGMFVKRQLVFSNLSLTIYEKDPATIDPHKVFVDFQNRMSLVKYVPDTHFVHGFGHLMSYSAEYYTYMWSLVIAKDLFGAFEKNGLYHKATAEKYRRLILEAGRSKPAEQLVRDYLGREVTYEPFANWVNKK